MGLNFDWTTVILSEVFFWLPSDESHRKFLDYTITSSFLILSNLSFVSDLNIPCNVAWLLKTQRNYQLKELLLIRNEGRTSEIRATRTHVTTCTVHKYCHVHGVTIDGVQFGNWFIALFYIQLVTTIYNFLLRTCTSVHSHILNAVAQQRLPGFQLRMFHLLCVSELSPYLSYSNSRLTHQLYRSSSTALIDWTPCFKCQLSTLV
jgi:hypothetical protein